MHSARIRSHQCKVLWSHLTVLNAKQLFTLRTSSGSSEPLTWYHHDHSGLSCQSEKSKNLRIFMLHQSIFVVIPRRLWRSESEANLQPDVELHHGSEVCEPIGSIAQFGLQGLQGSWRKKEIFLHKRGCKKNFVVFYVSSFSLSLSLLHSFPTWAFLEISFFACLVPSIHKHSFSWGACHGCRHWKPQSAGVGQTLGVTPFASNICIICQFFLGKQMRGARNEER